MAQTDLKGQFDTILFKKWGSSHHFENQGWGKEALDDGSTDLKSISYKCEATGFSRIPQDSWHLTVISTLEV